MTDRPRLAGGAAGQGEARCQTGKRPHSEKCRRRKDFSLSGRALPGPSRRCGSSLWLCVPATASGRVWESQGLWAAGPTAPLGAPQGLGQELAAAGASCSPQARSRGWLRHRPGSACVDRVTLKRELAVCSGS